MTHGWPGKRLVAEPSDPKDGAEREVAFVPRVSGFAPMSVHVPSCVERFSWEQTKDRYVAVKLGTGQVPDSKTLYVAMSRCAPLV